MKPFNMQVSMDFFSYFWLDLVVTMLNVTCFISEHIWPVFSNRLQLSYMWTHHIQVSLGMHQHMCKHTCFFLIMYLVLQIWGETGYGP